MIGYTHLDLINHLQSFPRYKKWLNNSTKYHIDHILPIQAFIDYNITDPKIINRLSNLQILTAKENLKKHDKYKFIDLYNFLKDNYNITITQQPNKGN